MKTSFPKHDKRQPKNRGGNANVKVKDHVFEKSSSEVCTYILLHIYIYEKLIFPNTIDELGIGIASPYFGMSLIAYRKRALHMFVLVSPHWTQWLNG